jgi:hypothetical protein
VWLQAVAEVMLMNKQAGGHTLNAQTDMAEWKHLSLHFTPNLSSSAFLSLSRVSCTAAAKVSST